MADPGGVSSDGLIPIVNPNSQSSVLNTKVSRRSGKLGSILRTMSDGRAVLLLLSISMASMKWQQSIKRG